MLLDIENISFESEFADFLSTFPSSRRDFVKRRLGSVKFKKMYYKSDNGKIRGYLVTPNTDGKAKKKHPVIIYNRGGNTHQHISGKKSGVTAKELFLRMGYFAEHGYVVVGSNYSGGYESEGKDEFGGKDLADILSLYNLLSDIDIADSSLVGMLGYSRGGMMSYLCMKDKTINLKAVITVGGVADLVAWKKARPEMHSEVFVPCFGGSQEGMIERSAIHFVDDLPDTPLLLLHGCNDQLVDFQQSLTLLKKGVKLGKTMQGVFYAGGNHSLTTHMKESFSAMGSRFDKYLK